MFLIRTAFWLVIIILILPTNMQDQQNIFGVAKAAIQDVTTFCSRNPQACEKGKLAFDRFAQKAEFGAKMLMDLFKGPAQHASATGYNKESSNTGARWQPSSYRPQYRNGVHQPQRFHSQNTLHSDDLKPNWRNPAGA